MKLIKTKGFRGSSPHKKIRLVERLLWHLSNPTKLESKVPSFWGVLVIFGPVLPRFRPVPLPARPPKYFLLITSDPGPTPTPLWSPGNVRGWAGPVGPHNHEKHQTTPISGSGNPLVRRPGESNRGNSFFPRSWGLGSPTLPPTAPR